MFSLSSGCESVHQEGDPVRADLRLGLAVQRRDLPVAELAGGQGGHGDAGPGVQRLPLPCLGECSILFIGKFFFIIIIFKVREFNNYPYPVWVSILFFLLVKNIFLFKQIRYIF